MTNAMTYDLTSARRAHDAVTSALEAMEALTVKRECDYELIHSLQAQRDDLHWRIEEMLADGGDKGAQMRLERACYAGIPWVDRVL